MPKICFTETYQKEIVEQGSNGNVGNDDDMEATIGKGKNRRKRMETSH